jgi:hypothetical protein
LLKDISKQEEYKLALTNRFQVLQELLGEETMDEQWKKVKEAVITICKEALRLKKHGHKEWITRGTLKKVADRKQRSTTAAQE